jgi:O-antigen/teichoic acid export membrane protein
MDRRIATTGSETGEMASVPPSMLRSGLHTLTVAVISVGIGFGQSILVARVLGPAGKGGYDLTFAAATLSALTLGLSLPSGTMYAIARGLASPGPLLRLLAVWGVVQGVVTAILVLAIRGRAVGDALVPSSLGLAVVAPLAVLVVGISISLYLRAVLVGRQRIIAANNSILAGRLVVPVVMLLGTGAVLAAGSRPGALMFVWCVILGLVVTCVCFAWMLRREIGETSGPTGLRTVLTFSLPAYLSNMVQFLNYRLDLFLVNALVGIRAVGIYALAVAIAQLLWLVSDAAATVLLPRVAAEPDAPGLNAVRTAQIARIVLWTCGAGAASLALIGQWFIPLVYGQAFRETLEPFLLLLPGVAVFTLVTVLSAYIAGRGRPSLNLIPALVGLAVTLTLDLTLIPILGVRGAAIASTASYLTSAVVIAAIFISMTRLSPLSLLIPSAEDARLLGRLVGELRQMRRTGWT